MNGFSVYVAAPYALAPMVRAIHERLYAAGCAPTSQWARLAKHTLEQLERCSPDELRSAWELNDACIDGSDAMLFVACLNKGGESFVELGRALQLGIPVLWTGERRILSSYRNGVYRVTLDEAMRALEHAAAAANRRASKTRLCGWFADWPIAARGNTVAAGGSAR
jgi:hypothetical protein